MNFNIFIIWGFKKNYYLEVFFVGTFGDHQLIGLFCGDHFPVLGSFFKGNVWEYLLGGMLNFEYLVGMPDIYFLVNSRYWNRAHV